MDFQWMLTTYVRKEGVRKKSSGIDQKENHEQVLQGGFPTKGKHYSNFPSLESFLLLFNNLTS